MSEKPTLCVNQRDHEDNEEHPPGFDPYTQYLSTLTIRDNECVQTSMQAIIWLAAYPKEYNVIRFKNIFKPKFHRKRNSFSFTKRKDSDLWYGIYSPRPITKLFIKYKNDELTAFTNGFTLEVPNVQKLQNKEGYLLFDTPLPVWITGNIKIEYTIDNPGMDGDPMEYTMHPILPVVSIEGRLREEYRRALTYIPNFSVRVWDVIPELKLVKEEKFGLTLDV